jgi:hypothetical protein
MALGPVRPAVYGGLQGEWTTLVHFKTRPRATYVDRRGPYSRLRFALRRGGSSEAGKSQNKLLDALRSKCDPSSSSVQLHKISEATN